MTYEVFSVPLREWVEVEIKTFYSFIGDRKVDGRIYDGPFIDYDKSTDVNPQEYKWGSLINGKCVILE